MPFIGQAIDIKTVNMREGNAEVFAPGTRLLHSRFAVNKLFGKTRRREWDRGARARFCQIAPPTEQLGCGPGFIGQIPLGVDADHAVGPHLELDLGTLEHPGHPISRLQGFEFAAPDIGMEPENPITPFHATQDHCPRVGPQRSAVCEHSQMESVAALVGGLL